MKGEKVDIEIDEISKDYIGKITQNVLKLIKSGFEIKEDDIRKLITICIALTMIVDSLFQAHFEEAI